jgi:two-component system chemotaxis response regulator CheY
MHKVVTALRRFEMAERHECAMPLADSCPYRRRKETGMASVLLVDANAGWLGSLALLISAEGHLVRTAHNGVDALRVIRESSPDVVVTDCKLPVMDGADLIRALRADPSFASIPVVLTAETRRRPRLPPVRFLIKPLPATVLLRELERLSRRRDRTRKALRLLTATLAHFRRGAYG